METTVRRFVVGFVLSLTFCGAQAQPAYPAKPVKVLVPYGPGSGVDVVVRIMSDALSKNLNQTFLVENRPGAGGIVATQAMLAQPADGYTLLSDTSSHTITPVLVPNIPYDSARDFSGITTLVENPLILVVGGGRGIRTLADLIALGKSKGNAMNFASAGVGTTSHIASEKFRYGAGLGGVHIPFKSTTDGLIEVMAGRIDFIVTAVASVQSNIAEGKLVALAMNSRRNPTMPNVPAIEETVPNAGYITWIGIMVSSKVSRDLVNRLNREIVRAMNTPESKERLAKIGTQPWTMSAEEFDKLLKQELADNAKLVKAAGIKM